MSVVLPTYDRNEYLPEAVTTVARQTYDPIELVVVDDCSPTPARETLADIDTAPLSTVRCLRHEKNRGANAARTTGIEGSAGEFIAFLDDDDEWGREKLARQVTTFRQGGEDVGVVYTGTRYVDSSTGDEMVVTPNNEGRVTRDILHGEKFGEFSALMVRSGVIEAAGGPDERFPSWQDREWLLRLSLHCEFRSVPDPLTVRRIGHGDQITDEYRTKRDVSYPMFVEKHRPLAAEFGQLTERRFLSSLLTKLGRSAMRSGEYGDARALFAKAILQYPLSINSYVSFVAALGGKHTHRFGRRLVRVVRSVPRS